jgi:hypothetical protein
MTNAKIMYLCDGTNTKCNYKINCGVKYLGGSCTRTLDIAYAKNFKNVTELCLSETPVYIEKEEQK